MNVTTKSCATARRLDDATANELSAVSGGTNMSFYNSRTRTGLIFHDNGDVEIWNNGVTPGTITGGGFVPCTSHCTTA
jgi:hypothetical protein